MGDWDKAKQKFDGDFERERREAARLQKIEDDLRNQARQLEDRARDLAERGKLAQALNALRRAEEAQARAEKAHADNGLTILQINASILGKLRAFAIFAEEFGER